MAGHELGALTVGESGLEVGVELAQVGDELGGGGAVGGGVVGIGRGDLVAHLLDDRHQQRRVLPQVWVTVELGRLALVLIDRSGVFQGYDVGDVQRAAVGILVDGLVDRRLEARS